MYRDSELLWSVGKVKRVVKTFRFKVIAACTLGSLFLALTGPFNTYSQGHFGHRLLFWAGLVAFSLMLAALIKPRVERRIRYNVVLREAVIISIFLPIFLPILLFWIDVVFPHVGRDRTPIWFLAINVLGVSILVSAGLNLINAMMAHRSFVPRSKLTEPSVRLIRRLPDAFGGRVLRLSGDGHLVKIVTTDGTYLLRMRLRDAVDEMDGVPGFWSHRSHWVATEAVHRWTTHKGRPKLVLSNGDRVPVGAKYQPELEAAGFDFARGMETENA